MNGRVGVGIKMAYYTWYNYDVMLLGKQGVVDSDIFPFETPITESGEAE